MNTEVAAIGVHISGAMDDDEACVPDVNNYAALDDELQVMNNMVGNAVVVQQPKCVYCSVYS